MVDADVTSRYWEKRHRELGRLASGGDRGLTEPDNLSFYLRRLGTLLSIVGPHSDPGMPLQILDAGCGRGFFSEHLARCGHRVVGFDPSPTALESIPQPRSATYTRASISTFTWTHLFDVVFAIDVLFHILEDEVWKEAITKLASCVRTPGQLILTDHDSPRRTELGGYIVQRPTDLYDDLLGALDLRRIATIPYPASNNPNCFHVYAKGS